MMDVKTACVEKKNRTVSDIVASIGNQLGDIEPKLLIYFSSPVIDAEELSAEIKKINPGAETFGCTTSGEIISGKMLKESVVVMAFSSEVIEDVKIELVKNVGAENNIASSFNDFEKYYGMSMRDMDLRQYVGLILVDGLSGAEEKLMDSIGDLTSVTFLGGSAGDDLKFETTKVFANGKSCSDAAALALIKPKKGFDIIKTQSFKVLDKKLTATRVNTEAREVIEFNNRPAVEAYADAVGTTPDNVEDYFMSKPVGLMVDGEPYVRSPQQAKNGSIIFYCNVLEGMELSLLESADIIDDTREAVEKKKEKIGDVAGLINFHCILRTLELEQKGLTAEYGDIFTDIPTIGFSTYGEEYIGHINQTSTMLVFK